jgi:hypothetical protein
MLQVLAIEAAPLQLCFLYTLGGVVARTVQQWRLSWSPVQDCTANNRYSWCAGTAATSSHYSRFTLPVCMMRIVTDYAISYPVNRSPAVLALPQKQIEWLHQNDMSISLITELQEPSMMHCTLRAVQCDAHCSTHQPAASRLPGRHQQTPNKKAIQHDSIMQHDQAEVPPPASPPAAPLIT